MYENDEIGVNVYRTWNDRIGFSKDRIGSTHERTVYTQDTIGLIHVMKDLMIFMINVQSHLTITMIMAESEE